MFAAFRDDFEQLVGLKCSIVQCMVQHDGIYLVILTMTSSMSRNECGMDSNLCSGSVASSSPRHPGTSPG